jgi:ATP-dependent protease ClpP protease subunit
MNKKDDKNNPAENQEANSLLKELGVMNLSAGFESEIQYINIIGSIEGHMVLPQENKTTKYEHLIPQLVTAEENPEIKGLLLILNTVGGDVEAGLALSEMISTMSIPTVSLVLGGGHSIGIPLATSADYSFIAETATMTLHPIRTTGQVITSETTFAYLRKTQERVVSFIDKHSKADKSTIENLINRTDEMPNDIGTILFGQDAVDIGIIDEVGGLRQALNKLKCEMHKNELTKNGK